MVSRAHDMCKPGLDPIDCKSSMNSRDALSQLKAMDKILPLPEDTLEHRECAPEVRTADLNCEDAGTHDPIADANQDPETRIIDQSKAT